MYFYYYVDVDRDNFFNFTDEEVLRHSYIPYPNLCLDTMCAESSSGTVFAGYSGTQPHKISLAVLQNLNKPRIVYSDADIASFKKQVLNIFAGELYLVPPLIDILESGADATAHTVDIVNILRTNELIGGVMSSVVPPPLK